MSEERETEETTEPPGGARERGMIAARTGVKIGANYARYLSRRATGTSKKDARTDLHTRNAESLFTELTKLRGTALKMAQGLSMEPGVLPSQFSEILSRAQYEVPPMGPALVHRAIMQAFGKPATKVFESFESEAFAAASLGQVHRATLHGGRDVVVKIQYPNVRESIDSDLRLIKGLASRFLEKGSIDPFLNEVRERMLEETDYIQEGENIEAFAAHFDPRVVVTPRWIKEYSTSRVLTMTYVDGLHLKEYLETEPTQEQRDRYGQMLWDIVHVAGDWLRVHADAHPGNFLFREDGRLGILDFGCVKEFPRSFRDDLVKLYHARMAGDEEAQLEMYDALEMMSTDTEGKEREYLLDVLDLLGGIIESLYRNDVFDFGSGQLQAQFQEVFPRLTGRDAFSHRRPVGSHHFVFVNRLLAGMISILTSLGSRIDTRHARVLLDQVLHPEADSLT